MGWIVATGLIGVLVVAVLIIAPIIDAASVKDGSIRGGGVRKVGYTVAGVLLAIYGLATILSMFHEVPAGNVGVVYQFGAIVGQKGEGLVVTAPWQSVENANVQIQAQKFEHLTAGSSETQDVYYDVTLNWSISPTNVQSLYRNVGPNYFEKLVPGRIQQIIKDESVQYSAIEITQKRDEIRKTVAERLSGELLEKYSIEVTSLTIDNIAYSDAFNNAIEQKQVATQEALRAQEQVKTATFQAQAVTETAKGAAGALREEARGQADANALINGSLTPQLIQFQAVQKLADNIQIALVPSGQGIILDPATLLGGGTTKP